MEKKTDDPAGLCLDVSCRNSTGFLWLWAERHTLPTKEEQGPPGCQDRRWFVDLHNW